MSGDMLYRGSVTHNETAKWEQNEVRHRKNQTDWATNTVDVYDSKYPLLMLLWRYGGTPNSPYYDWLLERKHVDTEPITYMATEGQTDQLEKSKKR